MTSELSYDVILKVVLVGDTSVGKTNIMTKYISNEFNSNSKATVGVELGTKNFIIDGKSIKAQIWDTAGQERYRSITSAYYKGAKGCLLVYDITNQSSFDNIDKWLSDLKVNGDEEMSIILIGNKCDLENERKISKNDGEEKAKLNKMAFLETSALNGTNISKAFEQLINDIYEKNKKCLKKDDNFVVDDNKAVNINQEKEKEKQEKKCCG